MGKNLTQEKNNNPKKNEKAARGNCQLYRVCNNEQKEIKTKQDERDIEVKKDINHQTDENTPSTLYSLQRIYNDIEIAALKVINDTKKYREYLNRKRDILALANEDEESLMRRLTEAILFNNKLYLSISGIDITK